jgi:hypothetical protein
MVIASEHADCGQRLQIAWAVELSNGSVGLLPGFTKENAYQRCYSHTYSPWA